MRTLSLARIVGCVIALSPVALHAQAPRAKVGAYYFDGWSGKTHHVTDRLKTEFAHRKPVWGWLDDTDQIMRRQIDLAADHGIAFFAFCWYWPEEQEKNTPLNNALELYLRAENNRRLEFCLLVANHGGFRIGPKDWDTVCGRWIELFRRPTHVKVNGKPLLIFFSPAELLNSFGSPAAVKGAFDDLRRRCRDAGLGGVSIAACATPGPEHGWNDLAQLTAAGFDLFTGYNYPGAGRRGKEPLRPFAELVDGSIGVWNGFAQKSRLPYAPAVTSGWDMRPWEKADLPAEKQSPYYPDRTPQAVRQFVEHAIAWLDRNPALALPERLVMIYAWNENGEGGYLTPTEADGDAYLKAVRAAVFGD